jgi:cell division protein FtsA
LVDLGAESTSFSIFHEGKLSHLGSLRFAGVHVTGDIVQGLGVTQSDAERLKERWGVAYSPLVDPEETIELPSTPGQGARQVKRELLAHIIHQRLDEVFDLVHSQIADTEFDGKLPAGVILTGGGAHLPGAVELARDVFAMPARKGVPEHGISGLTDNVDAPRYTVPVGLAMYGASQMKRGKPGSGLGMDKWIEPVKRWLQDFF